MANNQLQFTHLPIHSFTHELFDNFYKVMQNKPNLPKAQINITIVLTKDYENVHLHRGFKKQAQSNPISSIEKKTLKKRFHFSLVNLLLSCIIVHTFDVITLL